MVTLQSNFQVFSFDDEKYFDIVSEVGLGDLLFGVLEVMQVLVVVDDDEIYNWNALTLVVSFLQSFKKLGTTYDDFFQSYYFFPAVSYFFSN